MKRLRGGEVLYIGGNTMYRGNQTWDPWSSWSMSEVLRVDPGQSQPVLVGQKRDEDGTFQCLRGLLLCQNHSRLPKVDSNTVICHVAIKHALLDLSLYMGVCIQFNDVPIQKSIYFRGFSCSHV